MTLEHTNVTAIRDLFTALRERDATTIARLLPEDAAWRFPGRRGKLAGEHRGREAILRFLASVMTLTDGTFELKLEDVVGGDDHVIVLFTGHAQRHGKTLENPTCLRIEMRNGLPSEFREFVWDLDHVDDFWA
ncbi:MAG: nuclear transport factor 2 family protein [Chloroflexi bacterium]|nr:nuclear transport factor 2 family protein [Chloroflexota bacterium]